LDFITENKNDINEKKKANRTTTTATEIFKCYKKAGKLNVPKK